MTDQNSKHTPTPWGHNDNCLISGNLDGYEHEAPFVADTADHPADGNYTAEERANADFIVRACNHHAALIVTLKTALRAINAVPRFRFEDGDSYKLAAHIETILAEVAP